ncbi:MAG: hypothetical protein JJE13_00450 [Thermoleophilia bacterium]|nr:hypothetical protein [Thermoleophilia bacterium]
MFVVLRHCFSYELAVTGAGAGATATGAGAEYELEGAEPLETGVEVAAGAGTTVVITRRLMIRLTVTAGRFGFCTEATLAPRAGSLPWASW